MINKFNSWFGYLMDNAMKVEHTRMKRSIKSGDLEELILLYFDVKSMAWRKFVDSRGRDKPKLSISPFLMLVEQVYIPTQDQLQNNNGIHNLLNYQLPMRLRVW